MTFIKSVKIGFVFILVLPLFSRANAQDVETIADVRCLLVGIQMSRSLDATQRASGTMVVMFYVGRLDRVVLGPKLEDLIANEASHMSSAEFITEATRCGKSLVEKGQLLQRIGDHLAVRGKPNHGDVSTPSR